MRARKKDWSKVDATILYVLRRAKHPMASKEIKMRGNIPPLHFDIRLQCLKHRGLICCTGRTRNAVWSCTR